MSDDDYIIKKKNYDLIKGMYKLIKYIRIKKK